MLSKKSNYIFSYSLLSANFKLGSDIMPYFNYYDMIATTNCKILDISEFFDIFRNFINKLCRSHRILAFSSLFRKSTNLCTVITL